MGKWEMDDCQGDEQGTLKVFRGQPDLPTKAAEKTGEFEEALFLPLSGGLMTRDVRYLLDKR